MPKSPQDTYARHLLSPRGYPLWTPEPSQQLLAYRGDGLRIGDVGVVIPEDGCFDVFFNICLPQDHPFHRATGVPDSFEPIQLSDMDIRTVVDAENPGRVLANSSVKSFTSTARRAADSPSRTPPPELEYGFTLSSSGGALLILPDGADRHDLRNHHRFLEVATQHGADWYRFAEEKVGQIIANDSLYLITGLYKTTSWSLAAFEKTAGTADCSAQFRIAQADGENVATTYTWDTTRALDWRVGPRVKYLFPNQAVFIRGFKIALRTSMFGTKRISVKTDAPSTRSNPARSSGRLAYTFGGLSTDKTPQPSGSGMQDKVAVDSALDDDRDEIQNKGALAVGEHVVIHRIPEASQAFHPSDIINQYLLNKEPSANIAITHDDVWITMLEEKLLQPEDLTQEGRLETLVSQKYDTVSEGGAVYLRNRNFASFEDFLPIVTDTSSTSTRSGQEQVSALQDPKHASRVTLAATNLGSVKSKPTFSLFDLPAPPQIIKRKRRRVPSTPAMSFNPRVNWIDPSAAGPHSKGEYSTSQSPRHASRETDLDRIIEPISTFVPSGRQDDSATPNPTLTLHGDVTDTSPTTVPDNEFYIDPSDYLPRVPTYPALSLVPGAQPEHSRVDQVDPFAAGPRCTS